MQEMAAALAMAVAAEAQVGKVMVTAATVAMAKVVELATAEAVMAWAVVVLAAAVTVTAETAVQMAAGAEAVASHPVPSEVPVAAAVTEVEEVLFRSHPDVVDADLSDYYGSIPHAELLKSVARRVVD